MKCPGFSTEEAQFGCGTHSAGFSTNVTPVWIRPTPPRARAT